MPQKRLMSGARGIYTRKIAGMNTLRKTFLPSSKAFQRANFWKARNNQNEGPVLNDERCSDNAGMENLRGSEKGHGSC